MDKNINTCYFTIYLLGLIFLVFTNKKLFFEIQNKKPVRKRYHNLPKT